MVHIKGFNGIVLSYEVENYGWNGSLKIGWNEDKVHSIQTDVETKMVWIGSQDKLS